MATTPKENKQFLDRLINARSLSFGDAIAVFANRQGKINRDAVEATLNHLWIENLFVLHDASGNEASWMDDDPYDNQSDYTLKFVGVAGKENNFSKQYASRLREDDVAEIEPKHCWARMELSERLRIFGDRADAPLLAERIRAFTNFFAFHLMAKNHERIDGLFSTRSAKGQTLSTLLDSIAKVEKQYGPFEHFDHVEVISVYSGDISGVSASAQMKLPKGVKRSEQRGESKFQIVSVCTPNGVFVDEYTVGLSIIEEDGLFRIVDASTYAGY